MRFIAGMVSEPVVTVFVIEEPEMVPNSDDESMLTLAGAEMPFNAGQIVALPAGVEHELRNAGSEPVVLITFFTPPIS